MHRLSLLVRDIVTKPCFGLVFSGYLTVYSQHTAKLFLLGVSALGCCKAYAQSKTLSLQEARKIAAASNREVIWQQQQQQLQEQAVALQQHRRLPDVNFHASYARISGLVEFRSGLEEVRFTTIPEVAELNTRAQIPLYMGSQIKHSIARAKEEVQLEKLKTEKVTNDIQIAVTARFLGICKLMEEQRLLDENIKEEQDRLQQVKALLKHGSVTGNEVLRAEYQLSDRKLQLISNKTNILTVRKELQTLLQLTGDMPAIDASGLLIDALPVVRYDECLKAAWCKEEIRMAELQTGIAQTSKKIAMADYYPRIHLFAAYDFNYPNYMFFPADPYAYTLGRIGIALDYSISSLFKNKPNIRMAQQRIGLQEQAAAMLKDKVEDEVYRCFEEYQEMSERIAVMEKAKELAVENYRIVKLKYLNQLALVTDMIDADNALLQASFLERATRIDALMKYYELQYATGLVSW